jgi:hypothetical protein
VSMESSTCARAAAKIWREQKKNKLEGFTCGGFIVISSMSGHIVAAPVGVQCSEGCCMASVQMFSRAICEV